MNKNTKIILYVITTMIVIALLISTFFPGMVYAVRDAGAGSSGSNGDICKPRPGYTEAEWRDHMSHHPSIYGECL